MLRIRRLRLCAGHCCVSWKSNPVGAWATHTFPRSFIGSDCNPNRSLASLGQSRAQNMFGITPLFLELTHVAYVMMISTICPSSMMDSIALHRPHSSASLPLCAALKSSMQLVLSTLTGTIKRDQALAFIVRSLVSRKCLLAESLPLSLNGCCACCVYCATVSVQYDLCLVCVNEILYKKRWLFMMITHLSVHKPTAICNSFNREQPIMKEKNIPLLRKRLSKDDKEQRYYSVPLELQGYINDGDSSTRVCNYKTLQRISDSKVTKYDKKLPNQNDNG